MHRRTLWLLLAVLIIATFLRTYHLTSAPPGLYPDEAMNGSNALEALRTHQFKVFYPENGGREGLFMNIQAFFLWATGLREPWVLRLPSAIFGVLTVLGLFLLLRELFRSEERGTTEEGRWTEKNGRLTYADRVALLAAFLLATSFWHINFSRIGFRAITASFFLIWALYFLRRALRSDLNPKFSILYSSLGGISFGLGFYSYISYRTMPLLLLLFVPFFRRTPGFRRTAVIFLLATFLVAAPIGWYFLKHPADFFGRTAQVSVTSSAHPLSDLGLNIAKTIGMLDIRGDGNWRHNVSGRPELFWPVGIMFWIGVGVACVSLFRRTAGDKGRIRFVFLLLFGWILLAALSVVLSDEGIPHALRSLLMIGPIMTIAAVGGMWIYDRILYDAAGEARAPSQARRALRLAAGALLLVLCLEAYHTYFGLWAKDPNVAGAFSEDYAALGRSLRSVPDSVPKYVIIEPSGYSVAMTDPWSGRVHHLPILIQTVMFFTDTFSPERQAEHNVHYIVRGEDPDTVPPPGSYSLTIR